MIWTYITVLSLGLLLGWKLSRLFDQISKTTSSPQSSPDSIDSSSERSPNPTVAKVEGTATPEGTEDGLGLRNPSSPASPTSSAPPDSETLQLAYEMAHHLGQYKAGFLARTSHELRSPLNRVMSLQQLILADLCDNPEEERDFTRQSYEAAQELLDLLDQTTAISKLEHGTVNFTPEPVSLVTVLSELQMQTELHARNRNLRLSIEQPNTDVEILTDPRWLRQVLINLVTTPIYLMDSGHIDVTHQVNRDAKVLSITVTDERSSEGWSEGWSEPMDLLEKKVEKDPTISAKSTATLSQPSSVWGLSLITTIKLVEAMNGNLTILSTPSDAEEAKTVIQCTIPLL